MKDEYYVDNAYRDVVSGAVIFDDEEGERQARLRRSIAEDKRHLSETVNFLKDELSEMKEQINRLIQERT